ncbi:unnamed protein product, partial [Gulo gulo]
KAQRPLLPLLSSPRPPGVQPLCPPAAELEQESRQSGKDTGDRTARVQQRDVQEWSGGEQLQSTWVRPWPGCWRAQCWRSRSPAPWSRARGPATHSAFYRLSTRTGGAAPSQTWCCAPVAATSRATAQRSARAAPTSAACSQPGNRSAAWPWCPWRPWPRRRGRRRRRRWQWCSTTCTARACGCA